jgi:prepilin-type N-terminal cleavage/methylation domain-containing protein
VNKSFPIGNRQSSIGETGFTLVEILVTVALLSFIILGLYATFTQVQRAFTMSMSQVDQLEAGRAVTELLPRELEQIIPCRARFPNGVNFYAEIPYSIPLTNALPGTGVGRTNVLEDCFLLLRDNQNWVGIGYVVRIPDSTGALQYPEAEPGSPGKMGIGSLYRFTTIRPYLQNNGVPQDPSQLFTDFWNATRPGSTVVSNRICDGVIHFRFRAFDTNGVFITQDLRSATDIRRSTIVPWEIGLYKFCSNAVPAAVEMELGIVDQRTWDRYNSLPTPAARLGYLQREVISSRVSLFRQRVPVRNVDPSAYQ